MQTAWEPSNRSARLARPLLIATALAQVAGLILSTLRNGTPQGTWLFLEARWTEQASLIFERTGAGVALLGVLVAAFSGSSARRWVGACVASAWFLLFAIFEWAIGGAPFTQLALLAHATRIAAPLLLAAPLRSQATLWATRAAVALTFATHGFEAGHLHPQFVDYLLAADLRLFHFGLTQGVAEAVLRVVGVVDVLVALLILTGRDLRPVLLWAAAWGVVTAAARVVQGGEGALHHALIRAANGGLPLALLLSSRKAEMNLHLHRFRRGAARAVLPLLLLAAPLAAHAQALSGAAPGHLRLVWTEDPAHQGTLSWDTTASGSTHAVYFDTVSRAGNLGQYAHRLDAQTNGSYQSGGPYYHHAQVTGLAPSTRYYFVVVSDGVASPERNFVTAPADDRAFRLMYGGDSRTGVTDRQKMNQLISTLVEADPGIVALGHGGDYVETANSWSEWNSWLNDHALTFTASGRVLPIIPVRGNHEGDGSMFNQVFGFPGGTAVDYYVTRLGQNVSLITLDTNVSIGGEQAAWLEQQLQAAQSGRWIIPSYHRPAYPAVKDPSGARQFWVPLFEKYNVDVACEADGHVLKRTVPIRGEKPDPTGVVYVGEGGLGVPQRIPIAQWYLAAPGMAKSTHHLQIFSIRPDKLIYEARAMGGGVEDHYEFSPRRTPAASTAPDTTPPALEQLGAVNSTQLGVTFSVDMDAASVSPASISVSGGVQVKDVAAITPRTFSVSTSELAKGTEYTLTVSGVRSAAGATLSAPVTRTFTWTRESTLTLPPPSDPSAGLDPAPLPKDQLSGCSAAGGALAWMGIAAVGAAVWRRRRARAR